MPRLHQPDAVFAARHLPSWYMLAFSSGAVNAIALLACQRFVTHVTGTVTLIGLDIVEWWLLFDYAFVLVCFVVGAASSVVFIEGSHHRGWGALYNLPLLLVSSLLLFAAVTGHMGYFGPFGGTSEEVPDFVFLSVLSFAMGHQNAAVATATGMIVRTTHLTGPTTDLGINLGQFLFLDGEGREAAWRGIGLRAGKILAFTLGAASVVPMAATLEYLTLILPATLVLCSHFVSFTSLSIEKPASTSGAR